MPKVVLTEARVKALRPGRTAYDIRDDKLRGFGIRVLPSGRKRFFVHSQHQGERVWRIVGNAGTMTIGDARSCAVRALAAIQRGHARVVDYCRALVGHRDIEELHLLFLDTRNRLIRDERHQSGTLNHTPVYPRQICVRALELRAAALVILHNHPSGDPTPSRAHVEMTGRLRDSLKTIDVALHDHVVVTASTAVSFGEQGLLYPPGMEIGLPD